MLRKLLFIIPLVMTAYDAALHLAFAIKPKGWWYENSYRWWPEFFYWPAGVEPDIAVAFVSYNWFWFFYYLIASTLLMIGILRRDSK